MELTVPEKEVKSVACCDTTPGRFPVAAAENSRRETGTVVENAEEKPAPAASCCAADCCATDDASAVCC
ncbi:MAG TPA: hypothetical protein VGQ32_00640 [Thermoanaerobaculia bacterium]|nr:hypothetical protein [Thermoanaerobaculia bacterium]